MFHQCIDIIFHKVYICTYCMVCCFWVHFALFLILKGTCSVGWFTVMIQVSSLKWAVSLISQKKFCKSAGNWLLLYLFEVGMKLRFLFRSLYVSKENQCFDKFRTFPDGSDLYLSAYVVVRCILKVFAFFLERNSVSMLVWVWPLEVEATWMFFGLGCSFLFSVYFDPLAYHVLFSLFQQFDLIP